jgi:hypothetical protein
LRIARIIPKRLAGFRAKIGTDHQCPRCWLQQEARSTLEPLVEGLVTRTTSGAVRAASR